MLELRVGGVRERARSDDADHHHGGVAARAGGERRVDRRGRRPPRALGEVDEEVGRAGRRGVARRPGVVVAEDLRAPVRRRAQQGEQRPAGRPCGRGRVGEDGERGDEVRADLRAHGRDTAPARHPRPLDGQAAEIGDNAVRFSLTNRCCSATVPQTNRSIVPPGIQLSSASEKPLARPA